jgi:hypothetical protein
MDTKIVINFFSQKVLVHQLAILHFDFVNLL